jgi:hypothetical protein
MSALGLTLIMKTWLAEACLYVGLAMTLAATALYVQDGLRGLRERASTST